MVTYEWLRAECEHDLFLPWTAQARKNILVGDVLHASLVVVGGVILEDDAVNLVGGTTQPTLLDIVENALDLGLWARNVRHLTDRNT